jgi:hypothetical protein
MKGQLTVTGKIQRRTCCVIVNIYPEAPTVGVSSDIPLEYLNQLRDDQYHLGALQVWGRTF